MKIGILYNYVDKVSRGFDQDKIADNDIITTVQHMYSVLSPYHEVIPVLITSRTLSEIAEAQFDIVFNVCEGVGGNVEGEAYIPAVLDLFQIPYTGSNHLTLGLCLDKVKTKQILQANDLPTPKFQVFRTIDDKLNDFLQYPLIVKPIHEDASIGISKESVVHNLSQLRHQISNILDHYDQAALVEEYIAGREINIALLGNDIELQILPPSEVLFDFDDSIPHIVDYESKWIEDSFMYTHTHGTCPAILEPAFLDNLNKMAKQAYQLTGCRDYARVDFRVRGTEIFILELNPNPGINIDSGFVRSAQVLGWTYQDLIFNILQSAAKRYHKEIPTPTTSMCSPPFYQSERLDFYTITYAHLDLMSSWFNDPKLNQYMAEPEQNMSKEQLIIDFLLHPANSARTGIALMIYGHQTNVPVGYCAIYDTSLWNQTAEISYLIGNPVFTGKGYGVEIVNALVYIGTQKLQFYRLEATATVENIASWKVLEKAGFHQIGKRTHSHVLNNKRMDDLIFEYLREN
jgi:D-alanine-D-alanine ligase